ncbi:MAG: PAS domain S-box protein [Anaerolineae bacterium]|nr:PAS domain S-box protein [Anaerolineae bacterium]
MPDLKPQQQLDQHDETGGQVRLEESLEAVHTLAHALVSARDESQIACQVVDAVERALPFSVCAVWMVDEVQRQVVCRAASAEVAAVDTISLALGREQGIVAAAVHSGEMIYVPDTSADPRFVDAGLGYYTDLCLPLRVGDRILGVLEASSTRLDAFDPVALCLLVTLADQAALAIENVHLWAELAHLQDFHERLVNNMTEGMSVQDADGRVIFVNPSAAAMFGYTPSEVLGRQVIDLLPAALREVASQAMARRRAGQRDRYQIEIERSDGKRLPILVAGRPLYEGDRFAGSLAVYTDLTEVKQLQTQLIQAAKLSATGRLAASLAHEINNPLQAIHNGLQILLTFPVGPEEQRDYLQVASREVERLIEMVGRILDFSRRPKLEMEEIEINDVVGTVLTLSSKYLQHRGIMLYQDLACDLPCIWAAPDALKQVFLNLVINAAEAMREGGELRVATWGEDDGSVAISFVDTGIGIPAGNLDRVFEPFYTTKDRSSGLGLAVSHNVVRQHGGRIVIESKEGVGTSVIVHLPLKA